MNFIDEFDKRNYDAIPGFIDFIKQEQLVIDVEDSCWIPVVCGGNSQDQSKMKNKDMFI